MTVKLLEPSLGPHWAEALPPEKKLELAQSIHKALVEGTLAQFVRDQIGLLPMTQQLAPALAAERLATRVAQLHIALGAHSPLGTAPDRRILEQLRQAEQPGHLLDRSPIFKTLREGSKEGIVAYTSDMPCSKEAFSSALRYCTTLRATFSTVQEAVEMVQAADYLGLSDLRLEAQEYLSHQITTANWRSMLTSAREIEAGYLECHCLAFYLHERGQLLDDDMKAMGLPGRRPLHYAAEEVVLGRVREIQEEVPSVALFEYLRDTPPDLRIRDPNSTDPKTRRTLGFHTAALRLLLPNCADEVIAWAQGQSGAGESLDEDELLPSKGDRADAKGGEEWARMTAAARPTSLESKGVEERAAQSPFSASELLMRAGPDLFNLLEAVHRFAYRGLFPYHLTFNQQDLLLSLAQGSPIEMPLCQRIPGLPARANPTYSFSSRDLVCHKVEEMPSDLRSHPEATLVSLRPNFAHSARFLMRLFPRHCQFLQIGNSLASEGENYIELDRLLLYCPALERLRGGIHLACKTPFLGPNRLRELQVTEIVNILPSEVTVSCPALEVLRMSKEVDEAVRDFEDPELDLQRVNLAHLQWLEWPGLWESRLDALSRGGQLQIVTLHHPQLTPQWEALAPRLQELTTLELICPSSKEAISEAQLRYLLDRCPRLTKIELPDDLRPLKETLQDQYPRVASWDAIWTAAHPPPLNPPPAAEDNPDVAAGELDIE
jgi:hypothetical protein